MPGRRFKAEEIVNELRQADVELARGSTVAALRKPSAPCFRRLGSPLTQTLVFSLPTNSCATANAANTRAEHTTNTSEAMKSMGGNGKSSRARLNRVSAPVN
ncbi:MAG: hypothetical protein RLZZ238_46 [Planctomycetota bacterium]|jgi:hypothetical protein